MGTVISYISSYIIYIIGVTIVAIISAFVGGLINKKFFTEKSILSMPSEAPTKDSYAHLNGRWHEYHVTIDISLHSEPLWLRGECHLNIKKGYLIEGFHKVTHHPKSPLEYKVMGEIRNGRMILTENCIRDTSDFFTVVYPNLLSESILIGIWVGFDWQRRPISGPIILSRGEMNIDELNKRLTAEELKYVFKGEKIDKLFG